VSDDLRLGVARTIGVSPLAIQISVRTPLDHQSNRLYNVWADGRHLILKEYLKAQEFAAAPTREFEALRLMLPLDIAPRPVVLHATPTPLIDPFVIYEYLEGAMWDRQRPAAADLAALAEVWLRMHAVERQDLWLSRGNERPLAVVWAQVRARLQTASVRIGAMSPEGREAADLCRVALCTGDAAVRRLIDHEPPLCFCRADPRFANIIRRPDNRLAFVDWEDSGLRDPAREVADLLTHPNQEDLLSPDEWQSFLQPYFAARTAADPKLQRRVSLYLAIFPLYWLAVLLDRGIHLAGAEKLNEWTINELPANVRLRRYLARALAWPATDIVDRLASLGDLKFFSQPI
jgi:aminoglycoside phosphotransferase (APT) family kinase protein